MIPVLHLVEQADLKRLLACPEETVNASYYGQSMRRAMGIMLEIVRRLPEPRAYLIEPSHQPDHTHATYIWGIGNDLLCAYLNERRVSVIDPTSLRELALFCPALLNLLDATDPLWLYLVASGAIQQVYIPRDGLNNKRHKHARERAHTNKIEIHEWHLDNGPHSRPSQP